MNEPKEFKLDPDNELHELVINRFKRADAFAYVIESLAVRIRKNQDRAWELLHKIFDLDDEQEWRYDQANKKVINLEHLIQQGLNTEEEKE